MFIIHKSLSGSVGDRLTYTYFVDNVSPLNTEILQIVNISLKNSEKCILHLSRMQIKFHQWMMTQGPQSTLYYPMQEEREGLKVHSLKRTVWEKILPLPVTTCVLLRKLPRVGMF